LVQRPALARRGGPAHQPAYQEAPA